MRPGDFSPGNLQEWIAQDPTFWRASMRPGDFSPGNPANAERIRSPRADSASMRPGDFSPGNLALQTFYQGVPMLQ